MSEFAENLCKDCKKNAIDPYYREEYDYSDFYAIYGYVLLIANKYDLAMGIFESAEKELEEELEIHKNNLSIV
jgi:hypothetical protein